MIPLHRTALPDVILITFKMNYQLPLIVSKGRLCRVADLSKARLIQYVTFLLNYEIEEIKSNKMIILNTENPWWHFNMNVEELASTNAGDIEKVCQTLNEIIRKAYEHFTAGRLIYLSGILSYKSGSALITLRSLPNLWTEIVKGNGEVIITCPTLPELNEDENPEGDFFRARKLLQDCQNEQMKRNSINVLVIECPNVKDKIYDDQHFQESNQSPLENSKQSDTLNEAEFKRIGIVDKDYTKLLSINVLVDELDASILDTSHGKNSGSSKIGLLRICTDQRKPSRGPTATESNSKNHSVLVKSHPNVKGKISDDQNFQEQTHSSLENSGQSDTLNETELKWNGIHNDDNSILLSTNTNVLVDELNASPLDELHGKSSGANSSKIGLLGMCTDKRKPSRDPRVTLSKSKNDSGYESSNSSPNHQLSTHRTLTSPVSSSSRSKLKLKKQKKELIFPCQFCQKRFSHLENAQEHEKCCTRRPSAIPQLRDPRDDESAKDSFLAGIGLTSTNFATLQGTNGTVQEPIPFDLCYTRKVAPAKHTQRKSSKRLKKLREKPKRYDTVTVRTQLTNFIKKHPTPVTSGLGRRLVLTYDHLSIKQREKAVVEYEKFCKSRNTTSIMKPGIIVNSKRAIRRNFECHKYSFNKRERITRNSEIVIGINQKSFPSLNKCRGVSVRLTPMRERYYQDKDLQQEEGVKSWSRILQIY